MERHLIGISAILASLAILVWSIGETFAYPQGPNVSYGSNPVFTRSATGNSNVTLFTNNTNSVAIITDLTVTGPYNYACTALFSVTNNNDSYRLRNHHIGSTSISLQAGLPVPAGESLIMNGNTSYCESSSVSGYYAH